MRHDSSRFEHDEHDYGDDHVAHRKRSGKPERRKPRKPRFDDEPARTGRLTEAERRRLADTRADSYAERIPAGADRWSTWGVGGASEHGPGPVPAWVVTELGAVDTDLGVLKTGKEADVHLLRRGLPDDSRECLLASKRYRADEHKQFRRDVGYLEGRRLRRSREMRAIEGRTSFGRNLIAEQWAVAEFAALRTLWTAGAPVPYPVQLVGSELLMEFVGEIGDDGAATAAPRLAQLRPDEDELRALWHEARSALELLAEQRLCHGDLSPWNILVHNGHVVLIDLPQVVDLVANPHGFGYLDRDVRNIATWFAARGMDDVELDIEGLLAELRRVALLT